MRMEGQVGTPCMKDADYAGLCSHIFFIGTEIQQSFCHTSEKQIQKKLFVCLYQQVQLMRYGEHHMIVGNVLDKLCIAFELPLFCQWCLAAWTCLVIA